MQRREFITLIGGAAAALPLPAHAQRPERMRLIGALTGVADEPIARARATVFIKELQELGWIDGRNMRVDYRWGGGDADIIRRQAIELVALAPDVILATGGPATERVLQATRSIPIVFAVVPDPVGSGLVARLSRPGGNATGFMQFEYSLSGKWLEQLKQVAPSVTRAAVLRDPAITAGIGQFAVIQAVAPSLGIEVSPVNITDATEIERAVSDFAREPNGGLIVGPPLRTEGFKVSDANQRRSVGRACRQEAWESFTGSYPFRTLAHSPSGSTSSRASRAESAIIASGTTS